MLTKHRISLLLLLLVVLAIALPTRAQNSTAITFTVPPWVAGLFEAQPELLDEFKAAHPGVRVVLVKASIEIMDNMSPYNPDTSFEDYLNAAEAYASLADVLYVTPYEMLRPEITTAGYLLDLDPLISADSSLNPGDFYPNVLESVRWDEGTWAVPSSAEILFFAYQRSAFDAVGLSYPNASWTIDDLEFAIRELSRFDSEGNLVQPGLMLFGQELVYLFRSLSGQPFYDPFNTPAGPALDNPAMIELATRWQTLIDENLVSGFGGPMEGPPAMRIGRRYDLLQYEGNMPDDFERATMSLLPGGGAGVQVSGFAVSAGTSNPELAYELARYLADKSAIAQGMPPARQSLNEGGVGPYNGEAFMSPEDSAFMMEAFANAFPEAEMRYALDLAIAMDQKMEQNMEGNLVETIQATQAEVQANFDAALARRGTVISVNPAPPEVVVGAGQSVLDVVIDEYLVSSNQAAWNDFAAQFIASHPDIAAVNFASYALPQERVDCFVDNSGSLPFRDLSQHISLDPFISTDPRFAGNDLIQGVMQRVSFQERVWGYPLSIMGGVLTYSAETLAAAGVPEPVSGWTIDEFEFALRDMQAALDFGDGVPPFMIYGDMQQMMILITAYGGQMYIDQNGVQVPNLEDPATVEAIRRTLELARDGLYVYMPLSPRDDMPWPGFGEMSEFYQPIMPSYISPYGFASQDDADIRYVTYPTGVYTPATFDVQIGLININAENPEACYAFFSELSQRPDLTQSAPVFNSVLNSPAMAGIRPQIRDMYVNYLNNLSQPNVRSVTMPQDYLSFMWVGKAIDAYMFDGEEDLAGLLAEAQAIIEDFTACREANNLPMNPIFNSEEEYIAYNQAIEACAMQADPEFQPSEPRQ